ncbi:MAG: cell envelope integrity protein TolA [Alphaproteobacteria bacterium]|nr:cell envelope integrity protein TolA [Alphaproteobacteria bacterium]
MMVNINRFKILTGVAFMITLAVSDAKAFPLLCSDPSRLVASARVTMQEIMIIKQEVESNLKIIEEIRNGGFAAAGAMIFNKIQNGDYDRFGKALSNVKTNAQDMSVNVADREWKAKREEELRNSGMSAKEAKAKAQQEAAERMQAYEEAQNQARERAKAERGSNAFTNSYNWLKNNQSFTSGASNALTGVANGNWGQALNGAAGATGGAVGSEGVGNTIGSIGNIGVGVYDSISNGDGFGGTVTDLMKNSQINSGVSGVQGGYNQIQEEKEAARKAQEEAAQKQAEEIRKKNEEIAKQFKIQDCQACQEDNKKAGRDPMSGCFSRCSN